MQVNIDSSSTLSLPLIDRDEETAPGGLKFLIGGMSKNEGSCLEDSVDIEALLISGGVDLENLDFKQYWDSQNYLERISEYCPDILMLDHYMPPTRGLDVLKGCLHRYAKTQNNCCNEFCKYGQQCHAIAGADIELSNSVFQN